MPKVIEKVGPLGIGVSSCCQSAGLRSVYGNDRKVKGNQQVLYVVSFVHHPQPGGYSERQLAL